MCYNIDNEREIFPNKESEKNNGKDAAVLWF
jgi:hypothetical protein